MNKGVFVSTFKKSDFETIFFYIIKKVKNRFFYILIILKIYLNISKVNFLVKKLIFLVKFFYPNAP